MLSIVEDAYIIRQVYSDYQRCKENGSKVHRPGALTYGLL